MEKVIQSLKGKFKLVEIKKGGKNWKVLMEGNKPFCGNNGGSGPNVFP